MIWPSKLLCSRDLLSRDILLIPVGTTDTTKTWSTGSAVWDSMSSKWLPLFIMLELT